MMELIHELQQAGEQRGPEGGTFVWSGEFGDLTLSIRLRDFDRFGFLLEQISGASPGPIERNRLDEFARSVSYLTERLTVVEWSESLGGVARSQPEEMDPSERSYFELRVMRPDRFSLEKMSADRERRNVPFHLTVRQLERLLEDLARLGG